MSIRWVITLVSLWLGLSLVSGIMEQTYLGSSHAGLLLTLLEPNIPATSNFLEGTLAYVTVGRDWLLTLWQMFWFDYAMFEGAWVIVRMFFIAISLGMVFGLIQFIRGR